MPALKANEKTLKNAHKSNLRAAAKLSNDERPAKLMLSFYAAECGLKHMLMTRNRGSHLDDPGRYMTHNLRGLAKDLRLPKLYLPQCFRASGNSRQIDSEESHLAWRYGVPINPNDEVRLEKGLDELNARIAQDIP